jgi:hypothetical protein
MTKRSKFLLIATGLAALAVATVIAFEIHRLNSVQIINLTDQQAREILNRELPVGTDKMRVKQFLNVKGWAYTDSGSTIQSMVYDAAHNFMIRTDIHFQFFFDSKGKLVSYEIVDINTGP